MLVLRTEALLISRLDEIVCCWRGHLRPPVAVLGSVAVPGNGKQAPARLPTFEAWEFHGRANFLADRAQGNLQPTSATDGAPQVHLTSQRPQST